MLLSTASIVALAWLTRPLVALLLSVLLAPSHRLFCFFFSFLFWLFLLDGLTTHLLKSFCPPAFPLTMGVPKHPDEDGGHGKNHNAGDGEDNDAGCGHRESKGRGFHLGRGSARIYSDCQVLGRKNQGIVFLILGLGGMGAQHSDCRMNEMEMKAHAAESGSGILVFGSPYSFVPAHLRVSSHPRQLRMVTGDNCYSMSFAPSI